MSQPHTQTQPGRAALLVIDVQHGLFHKSTPIWHAEQVLAAINGLIERARAAGQLVVYIQHASDKVLPRGTADWQLESRLAPPCPGDLLAEKEHGNAFEKTSLQAMLDAHGIGEVVVTGLVTHGCVKATCLGALELGYRVTVAGDAHSSYSKDAAALVDAWNEKLLHAGAVVLPTAEISFR